MRFNLFHDSWVEHTLEECSYSLDYGLGASAIKYDGVNRYIRITDIDENGKFNDTNLTSPSFYSDEYLVKKNDILFARTGASVGKTYKYKKKDGRLYYAGFLINAHIRDFNNVNLIYNITRSKRYQNWIKVMSMRSGQPGINSKEYGTFKFYLPSNNNEKKKISELFDLLDTKIDTQIKIIEDFITLKTWIINSNFIQNNSTIKLSELILETNLKNKDNKCKLILSVNNKLGFIKQSEQFEDREVASNDTSNYKIVNKNDYAYNPARINVGSIARLINFDKGIVSPMYVCFKLDESKIIPAYFDMFLNSSIFKCQVRNKLEGSVRQCLTYSSLREIQIKLPSINEQFDISKKIIAIDKKIKKESELLMLLKKQKEYLLNNLFI